MKKRLLALLLLAASATTILTSCNNETSPETKNTETSAVTEEQGGSETTDLPTETQEPPVVDTKKPADTETPPETNENDSFNLENADAIPYKLLQMTFAEIEKEYGTMEYQYMLHGGTPVYKAENLPEMDIVFSDASATDSNGMSSAASDDIAGCVRIYSENYSVYPGLRVGMSAEEVKNILPEWSRDNIYYYPFALDTVKVYKSPIEMSFRLTDDFINGIYNDAPDTDEAMEEVISKFLDNPQGELIGFDIWRKSE